MSEIAESPSERAPSESGSVPAAEFSSFVLPDDPVSWGTPEHTEMVRNCLAYYGYHDVTVEEIDGAQVIRTQVPPAQQEAADAVLDQCLFKPVELGYVLWPRPPSVDELTALYRAWTEITLPCLQQHGYPTDDAPSLDSFVEAEGANWHPHQAVPFFNTLVAPDVRLPADQQALVDAADEMRRLCPSDIDALTGG